MPSAVYWNPAGLALGRLLFQHGPRQQPERGRTGRSQDRRTAVGEPDRVSALPVGVSYYRLSSSTLRQSAALGTARLDRLTTHHAGVTVVQQLGEHVAVGSTLKWVHGYAASGIVPAGDRDDLLDGAGDLPEHSTNKFDMDVGVMALVGKFHAGRDGAQPDRAGFHDRERQPADAEASDTRGCSPTSASPDSSWRPTSTSSAPRVRSARSGILRPAPKPSCGRRVTVRSGFRFNTIGDEPGGHAPVYSLGGTCRHVSLPSRRRPGHVRLRVGRPWLGRRRAPDVLGASESG